MLAAPKQFTELLRRPYRQDWFVYAKPAFGGPMQVLRYLGRYTHRVAISNHRIVAFDGERVTFRYKDYTHGGKHRLMTLHGVEFLRRFILHVLPKGLVRIRQFGFLANCCRTARIAESRQLLSASITVQTPADTRLTEAPDAWRCPRCGVVMVIVERLTAAELFSRSVYFDSS